MQFLETIRLENGRFYHLDWHQKRVEKVFRTFFKGVLVFNLKALLHNVLTPKEGLFRVRIVYDVIVNEISFIPYRAKKVEKLIVKNSDFAYQHKFEDRSCFEPVAPKLCDYLYHKEGVVKESSIANIAFFDGKQWETALFPYLKGTTRARYIASGWLVEKHITLDDLVKYKKVAMMNAMVGFVELGKCSDILSHKA